MESCEAVGTRNSIIITVTLPPSPLPPEDILIKELPAALWAHFQSRNLSHLSLIAPGPFTSIPVILIHFLSYSSHSDSRKKPT
jgi:hypothetical protein